MNTEFEHPIRKRHWRNRSKAQAVVEFALILPIALILIFVIIELARAFQAWLVVTNSARIGLRYAVTGAYETDNCTSAIDANGNGLICALEPDKDARTAEIDAARLLSIYQVTTNSAAGILKDLSVGDKTQKGYFHVTVCSTNDGRVYHPPADDYCDPNDHPGDPSNGPARVLVAVTFNNPVIVPGLNTLYPMITLHAERTGIVEQFRVARVLGLPPVIDVPTVTFPPTSTATTTVSPTPTPTPDCTLYTFSGFGINPSNRPVVNINNNSSSDVFVTFFNMDWSSADAWGTALGHSDIRVDYFSWNGNRFYGGDDYESPTDVGAYESLPSYSSGTWETDFDWNGEQTWSLTDEFGLTEENFGFFVQLSNGCVISRPATVLPVPEPECDLYSAGDFYFGTYAHALIDINNGDAYGTRVSNIELNWNYPEQYDVLVDPNDELNIDFINYGGQTTWGNGDGYDRDYDSVTSTSLDAPDSFPGYWSSAGLPPFDPGSTYTVDFDFDNEWPTFNNDLLSDDLGLVITFENGCVLRKPPVPRDLPQPNCDLYSATNFEMQSSNRIQTLVTNGDILSTEIERIVLDWDHAEALADAIIGPNNLYADWFIWDGSYIWSNNNDSIGDLSSVTDTSLDSPGAWTGPDVFSAGDTVNFRVDFDFALTSEYDGALESWGLIPQDFGATFYFTNGCVLDLPAIDRPVATPTPSCDNIFAEAVRFNDDNFEIRVRNNNTASAYLTNSVFTWPGPPPPQSAVPGQPYVNYLQFNYDNYYNTDTYYSPVQAAPSPARELPGQTAYWWIADFNNGRPYGYYRGVLTFNYPGWGDCIVTADLEEIAPTATRTVDPNATPTPTRTLRPTETPTRTPTRTLTPTITRSPTITPTPSRTPTPTRTRTPSPPTITLPPTSTGVVSPPTNTPEPTQPGGG